MTTDQIKTKLSRLVADWKVEAEAYEEEAKQKVANFRKGADSALAKAAVYRDHIWDLEQIIKEEE
jgi:hypothetical protein